MKTLATLLIILMGFLFHELYKWTGFEPLAWICPVNESKWEHWKIVFSPMAIVGIVEGVLLRQLSGKWLNSLAIGILFFEMVTFGSIELYDLLIGKAGLAVHILAYIAGALAGQRIRYLLLERFSDRGFHFWVGASILAVHAAVIVYFTYHPPTADYFRDSLTGTYGIGKEVR